VKEFYQQQRIFQFVLRVLLKHAPLDSTTMLEHPLSILSLSGKCSESRDTDDTRHLSLPYKDPPPLLYKLASALKSRIKQFGHGQSSCQACPHAWSENDAFFIGNSKSQFHMMCALIVLQCLVIDPDFHITIKSCNNMMLENPCQIHMPRDGRSDVQGHNSRFQITDHVWTLLHNLQSINCDHSCQSHSLLSSDFTSSKCSIANLIHRRFNKPASTYLLC